MRKALASFAVVCLLSVIALACTLVIITTSLPGGQIAVPYNQTVHSQGGTSPYTWTVFSGSLPTGLSLNASTGVISGTPSAAATYSFAIRVTDSLSATSTVSYSVTITSIPALSITTTSLPDGTQSSAYSATLNATGGTPPYTWSISSGSLPTGLSLNTSTGVISGTPSASGSTFTAHVVDSGAGAASQVLTITITAGHVRVNVPFAPAPGTTNYPKFKAIIIPSTIVDGITPFVFWNHVETSMGVYNFTALDNQLIEYVNAGKKANMALVAQPYGGNSGANASPAYVSALSGQDHFDCVSSTGKVIYANYLVLYETPARTRWKLFIKAVIQHYSSNVVTASGTIHPADIGYLRYGISIGDEAYFPCQSKQALYMGGTAFNTYVQNYVSDITTAVDSYVTLYSTTFAINPPSTSANGNSLAIYEDQDAASHSFWFGSHGLQSSDKTHYNAGTPATGDWAHQFDLDFALTSPYTHSVGRLLQTLCDTCPVGATNCASIQSAQACSVSATGPLPPLLTFAQQRHATDVEIYPQDMYIALNNGSYGFTVDPDYACCHTAYFNAIAGIR